LSVHRVTPTQGGALAWIRATLGQLRPGWLLATVLAAYIWYATIDWDVPSPGWVPFGPLWAAVTIGFIAVWRVAGRSLTPVAAMALGSIAAMTLTDVAYSASQNLRDLHIYVTAGSHFLDGQGVYLSQLLTQRPADLSTYPFLYPPLTLPFFAVLAMLPRIVVDLGWVVTSVAAATATLWLFGVRRYWTLVLLLWPPIFQGIQVGNVAVLAGLLFAVGPWFGAGLVIAAIFKLYSGLAALWLLRERRWLQLVAGAGLVLGAALVALPLTGLDRWREWLAGLDWYRASQPLLPASLYGFGLARFVPFVAFVAIAGGVTVAALRLRGRDGLVGLGLATNVASPSLYAHGLIVGLPAILRLGSPWVWIVIGITSVAPGLGWWVGIGLTVLAWFVPWLRRRTDADESAELHPLGRFIEPWPNAPFDAAG
jgi:hypothetical protein